MFTYELALAAVLVASPDDSWNQVQLSTWRLGLQPTLRALAIEAQILDARELIMAGDQENAFLHDLQCLQNRYADLLDAPFLQECDRFSPRPQIGDYLNFNRTYREHLARHFALDPLRQEEIRVAIQESQQLYHLWETLYNARTEYYYTVVRRRDLKRLRDLVGPESFYSGHLPPPVPVWRIGTWN